MHAAQEMLCAFSMFTYVYCSEIIMLFLATKHLLTTTKIPRNLKLIATFKYFTTVHHLTESSAEVCQKNEYGFVYFPASALPFKPVSV